MRSTDGAVSFGSVLGLISKIREVELFLLRSIDHIFKAVFWIVHVVVAVYRDQGDAFRLVIMLDIDQSLLVGLCVWAMVAAEDDNYSLFVAEILETVVLAVYTF